MREYAIRVRDHCLFVSLDDKHKVSVGEPDCPVASVERGRRVLVRSDEVFAVADHDWVDPFSRIYNRCSTGNFRFVVPW